MRVCKNCQFGKPSVVQMGNQLASIPVCQHPEVVDPVNGEPLPCVHARQNAAFCGFEGKYFKQREVVEAPAVDAPATNVIELAK